MIESYLKEAEERASMGIPPLPLNPEQTGELCKLLRKPPKGKENFLVGLLKERVSPGVDPAAKVKAEFLAGVVSGKIKSPLVTAADAVAILGTMLGGYNVAPLIAALKDKKLADAAAKALSGITLVYDAFDEVAAIAKAKNPAAQKVMKSWAEAEWFTSRPGMPETIKVKVFKVDGEINTDDFSPAGDAWSRPDIPLHALAMGKTRFKGGLETIAGFRKEGFRVAFVGDVVGTGSSRKSACNSVLWHIGEEIPCVPNKKTRGVIIGGVIAPIFFNTAQDSGALPLKADVTGLKTGDVIVIDTKNGILTDEQGKKLSKFTLSPNTLSDEFRAGGRIPLIIGRALTEKARKALGLKPSTVFTLPDNPVPAKNQGYSLAQKIVGDACGMAGVLPGTACDPQDDHRRLPGHHRADDRRRTEGTGVPQVPGADVHAVLLPHRGLPEAGRRQDAQEPARLRLLPRGRDASSRGRRHPLLAEPPPPARHGRHRRRLPHPVSRSASPSRPDPAWSPSPAPSASCPSICPSRCSSGSRGTSTPASPCATSSTPSRTSPSRRGS